jgi:hypothetical protein
MSYCYAVRHCPKSPPAKKPLEGVIAEIVKSKEARSYGKINAIGHFVYVIQATDTKPVQYELGYRYKVSKSELYGKPAYKNTGKHCKYFAKPQLIKDDTFTEWFASSAISRLGMTQLKSEFIYMLDEVLDSADSSAEDF